MIKAFIEYLNEKLKTTPNFEKFSENRFNGASDITDRAESKGGDSLLTYHHFKVKLPYYEKAVNGKFDPNSALEEYNKLLNELIEGSRNGVNIDQVKFQELVGKIEVLGELLIKDKEVK